MIRRLTLTLIGALALLGATTTNAQATISVSYTCTTPLGYTSGATWTCSLPATTFPYTGWANSIPTVRMADSSACTGSTSPTGTWCSMQGAPPAFRYNNGWRAVTIDPATLYPARAYTWYHAPFADGWSWIWNAKYGWLAMQSRYVMLPVPAAVRSREILLGCTNDITASGPEIDQFRRCKYTSAM